MVWSREDKEFGEGSQTLGPTLSPREMRTSYLEDPEVDLFAHELSIEIGRISRHRSRRALPGTKLLFQSRAGAELDPV